MSKAFVRGSISIGKWKGEPASGSHPGNYPLGRQRWYCREGTGLTGHAREGRYVLMYITAQVISDFPGLA